MSRGAEMILSWLWIVAALVAFLAQFDSLAASLLALVGRS